MSYQEGSCLVDFERFLVRVFTKVKDEKFNLRKVTFRRDDEPYHRDDLSVVVSVPLDEGLEVESLSADNLLGTYSSRFSFYRAEGFEGQLVKRTGVYDESKVESGELLWIATYQQEKLTLTKLVLRTVSTTISTGKNFITFPERYYPESAQLWFNGKIKEVASELSDEAGKIVFTSPHGSEQAYVLKYLEVVSTSEHLFKPGEVYYDLIPGTVIESSDLLEDHDRVLFRMTPRADPVYKVFGALLKCKVRLYVDPLNEVQAKRLLGNLFALTMEVQQELKLCDIPVTGIRLRTNTGDADVAGDRSRKVFVEFDSQFQYEMYVPIQRYVRDIRFDSIETLEHSTRSIFTQGDSF